MGLRYTMSFSDLAGREVGVSIYNDGWTGGVTVLTGGASPLTLDEDATEGIDRPCRAWTGVLTVRTEEGVDYSGLYAADVTSARVEVWRGGGLTWQGYLVPEVMRQSWVAGEELSVNVQSPLGALAGLSLDMAGGFAYERLGALLGEALALTGDWDTVTFPDDLSVGGGGTDTWLDVEVSRMTFFTREYNEEEWDEAEQARIVYEGATGREVVEAVARLTGWTARERGRELWLTAESVAGYKRVRVAELGLPGRVMEDVAAPVQALNGLTPAGTDHTVSTLPGYRRVRVRFGVERPDTLIPGNDLHNWEPDSAYEFREDSRAADKAFGELSRWWVFCEPYSAAAEGGFALFDNGAVNLIIAAHSGVSIDALSQTYLYGLFSADPQSGEWEVGDYPTYAGTPAIPRDKWGANISLQPGMPYASFAGAIRAVLTHQAANVYGQRNLNPYVRAKLEPTRVDCYCVFVAAWKNQPVPALAAEKFPAIKLTSPEEYYLYDCALKLSASVGGFFACSSRNIDRSEITGAYIDRIGPWSVMHYSAIKSLPMRLRVGDKWWNGKAWTGKMAEFSPALDEESRSSDSAGLSPSGGWDDNTKYGVDDAYLITLVDENGEYISLLGQVELTILFPEQLSMEGYHPGLQEVFYNPIIITGLDLTVVRPTYGNDYYNTGGTTDTAHTYLTQTGYKGTEDVYDVETRLGTWANDGCAMNVLIKDGAPVEAFTSKRQGGKTGRPERLLLSTLGRLYGRARRQLEVEVDAAGLPPSVTLTDGGRRYALTGLHWDVREGTARYVMEDFVAIDN